MARSLFSRCRLVVLASPLLAAPAWEYSMLSEEVGDYVRDTGVVVSHIEIPPRTGFPRYQSVIEYQGVNGEKRRFVDQIQRRPQEEIGKAVDVLVEPRSRRTAYRAGMSGHWFGFSVLTVLSLAGFMLAAGVTYFTNRIAAQRLKRMRQRRQR